MKCTINSQTGKHTGKLSYKNISYSKDSGSIKLSIHTWWSTTYIRASSNLKVDKQEHFLFDKLSTKSTLMTFCPVIPRRCYEARNHVPNITTPSSTTCKQKRFTQGQHDKVWNKPYDFKVNEANNSWLKNLQYFLYL